MWPIKMERRKGWVGVISNKLQESEPIEEMSSLRKADAWRDTGLWRTFYLIFLTFKSRWNSVNFFTGDYAFFVNMFMLSLIGRLGNIVFLSFVKNDHINKWYFLLPLCTCVWGTYPWSCASKFKVARKTFLDLWLSMLFNISLEQFN